MSNESSFEKHLAPFQRHKFDPDLRDQVTRHTLAHKPDNYHGVLAIMSDWTLILLCVTISEYAYKYNPVFFLWPMVYFLAISIIGARQRGLARGLHEATHECFCSNQYLNFFLGTFCSGYLMFQSFRGYQISHVKNHHPYLGTDRDPDYVRNRYLKRKKTIYFYLLVLARIKRKRYLRK